MASSPILDLKNQLATTCRMIAYMGWDEVSFTHCSLRVSPEHYLINAVGVDFARMTSGEIVSIDRDGKALGSGKPASFKAHKHFHEASAKHNVVLHSHYAPSVVLANLGKLPYLSQYEGMLGETLFLQDVFTGFDSSQVPSGASLSNTKTVFCGRHGVFVMGETVPEAFFRLFLACRSGEIVASSPQKSFSPFELAWPPHDQIHAFWNNISARSDEGWNYEIRKAN